MGSLPIRGSVLAAAEEAGEHNYCGTCGLHLAEQPELPTRAEWEAAAKPVEASSTDAASVRSAASTVPTPSLGPPAAASREGASFGDRWRRLSATRKWFVGGGAAAVVVVVMVILAAGGGGASSSGGANPASGSTPKLQPELVTCATSWNDPANKQNQQSVGLKDSNANITQVRVAIWIGGSSPIHGLGAANGDNIGQLQTGDCVVLVPTGVLPGAAGVVPGFATANLYVRHNSQWLDWTEAQVVSGSNPCPAWYTNGTSDQSQLEQDAANCVATTMLQGSGGLTYEDEPVNLVDQGYGAIPLAQIGTTPDG